MAAKVSKHRRGISEVVNPIAPKLSPPAGFIVDGPADSGKKMSVSSPQSQGRKPSSVADFYKNLAQATSQRSGSRVSVTKRQDTNDVFKKIQEKILAEAAAKRSNSDASFNNSFEGQFGTLPGEIEDDKSDDLNQGPEVQ